jgi:hypothetical protein
LGLGGFGWEWWLEWWFGWGTNSGGWNGGFGLGWNNFMVTMGITATGEIIILTIVIFL